MLKKLYQSLNVSKWKVLYSYVLFVFVSFGMLFNKFSFEKGIHVQNLQFGLKSDDFDDLRSYFLNSDLISGYYSGFFYFDMFFMSSILLFLFLTVKYYTRVGDVKYWCVTILILGVVAIISDIWENAIYLDLIGSVNPWVEPVKIGSITLLGVIYIIWLLINHLWDSKRSLYEFARSSVFSFLCLTIMALGLTFMPQGATLVVDVLQQDNPWVTAANLTVLFFLVNALALIVSHFPIYLEFAINNKDDIKWKMTHPSKLIKYWSIITYSAPKEPTTIKNYLRYILGILTYAGWFYVILKAFSIYQLADIPSTGSVFIVTILICIWFYIVWDVNKKDKTEFFNENYLNTSSVLDKQRIYNNAMRWPRAFEYSLFIGLILLVLWVVLASTFQWCRFTLWLSLLSLFVNTICYALFRLSRGFLVYYYGERAYYEKLEYQDFRSYNQYVVQQRKWSEDGLEVKRGVVLNWVSMHLAMFSNHVIYLSRINFGLIGIMVFFALCLIVSSTTITSVSGIAIIISFMISIYSIIIFVLKYLFFLNSDNPSIISYNSDNEEWETKEQEVKPPNSVGDQKGNKLISGLYNVLGKDYKPNDILRGLKQNILVVCALGLILITANSIFGEDINIHKLSMYKTSSSQITADQYRNALDITDGPMLQISSYGGGLKANLWNLLLLNRLDTTYRARNDGAPILDRTLSLSGVSGGMVGLGNYMAMYMSTKGEMNSNKVNEAIDKIGNSNIVSIDIAGLLGRDFWLEKLNKSEDHSNDDRSASAMKYYENIITTELNENTMNLDTSLSVIYAKEYDNYGHLPPLIINSASTSYKPGVGISLVGKDLNSIFTGYHVFQDTVKNTDLGFYDAISTSNRFPIMSPAAEVEGIGHFLDGGYFENSGLLTSEMFLDYIKSDTCHGEFEVVQLCVVNSLDDYVRHFAKENEIGTSTIFKSNGIASIINGITNIDKLPSVLRERRTGQEYDGNLFCEIYLPHYVTVEKLQSVLGGKVELTPKLLTTIKRHNYAIDSVLIENKGRYKKHWGKVEPPLARTLSLPAVEYQRAMIKDHPDVIKDLENVLSKMK